jgi:hypothetical protein
MTRAEADRIEIEADERQLHLTIGVDWGQVITLSVVVVVLAILPFIPIIPGGYQAGEGTRHSPETILIPLLLGLLGAVFLGYLVWEALGREEILVDDTSLTLVTRLFFLRWPRTIRLAGLTAITINERRQTGRDGPKIRRTIRFASGRRRKSTVKHLSSRDAARIVAMIEAWRAGTRDAAALARL